MQLLETSVYTWPFYFIIEIYYYPPPLNKCPVGPLSGNAGTVSLRCSTQ